VVTLAYLAVYDDDVGDGNHDDVGRNYLQIVIIRPTIFSLTHSVKRRYDNCLSGYGTRRL
jgi:hypothetical protein